MEVYLLSQFQVKVDGEVITTLNHSRLQELFAYLLLHQGKPVSRQNLAFLFWPNSTEVQARTNLRNLLYRLRNALPAISQYLKVDEIHLQWNEKLPCTLDVVEFEAAIQRSNLAHRINQVEILEHATEIYGGDLLPACYNDWLLAERERLNQMFLSALASLAKLYEEQRDYPKAIYLLQRQIRMDPLNENAYATLMRLHSLSGNRGQAVHVYHTCAEVLRRELGVDPSPAIRSYYEQLTQPSFEPSPAAPVKPLIARNQEWEQLTRAWRHLTHNRAAPRTILISGEAGIGKTHLAQSFIEWVQRQGYQTATAACYESGGDLAYAPVAAWLSVLYEQNHRLFDRLSPVWRLELARLLLELRSRDASLDMPGSLSEKWQLLHFYEALLHGFATLRSPLLLFLDDIHWCDPDTLAWLAYLQTKPAGERVVLVATALSEMTPEDHPVVQFFRQSRQNLILELSPLDETETGQLIEQLVGGPVEANLARRVYQQSEGNPLFVVEMTRSGLNQYSHDTGVLPKGIKSVIDWRLSRLSTPARQVLDLAAVIGRSFPYELLKQASSIDEQTLVNSLDECWRQHILREHGSQDYDFSHDTLRQVAYARLSMARRRLLHGRVAEALERLHAHDPSLVFEQIAHHLEAAGQADRAALYYERGAQANLRLFALPQASQLLEHALRLVEQNPDSGSVAARLQEQLGNVLLISGQYELARESISAALKRLNPEDRTGRARLHRLAAKTWSAQQRFQETGASIQAALDELGDEPPTGLEGEWRQEWLETRLQQMDYLYFRAQADEMQVVCEMLEKPLKEYGTKRQQSEYCTLRGMLNNRRQRYRVSAETIQIVRQALELAEQTGDPLLISRKHFGLGFNLLWYGDRPSAILELQEAVSTATKLGATFTRNQALAYLAIAYRMEGELEKANETAQQGLALAEAEKHPTYQGTALANLAWAAYRQGKLERAQQLAERALTFWGPGGYPMEWLANLPLAAISFQAGEWRTAQERLATIFRPGHQHLPDELEACVHEAVGSNGEVDPPATLEAIRVALDTVGRLGYL